MNYSENYSNTSINPGLDNCISTHARKRMHARNLGLTAVKAAMDFGRVVYTRGAIVYAIGRKEVIRCRRQNIDLRPFEGVQVICAPDGTIITTYRNHCFKKVRSGLGVPRYLS